jgi:hypothetical protein
MTDIIPWYKMHGMERELAKYDQCEEPGDCDHDHDNAVEYMREAELNELRAERDVATARAETAEAAYYRLDSEQAGHGSYAGRAEAAEAEVAELRAKLATRGDLMNGLDSEVERLTARAEQAEAELCSAYLRANRAENAAAEFDKQAERYHARALKLEAQREQLRNERDQLRAWLAEIGMTQVEWCVQYDWNDQDSSPNLSVEEVADQTKREAHAREWLRDFSRQYPTVRAVLKTRIVGGWRDVDATPHADLERADGEQGDAPSGSAREQLEGFLADEGRREVAEFMAEARGESDDIDTDAVIAQNHADHEAALANDPEGLRYLDQVNEPLSFATIKALRDALASGNPARFKKPHPKGEEK